MYLNVPPPSLSTQASSNPLDSFDPFGSVSSHFSRSEDNNIVSEAPVMISHQGTSRQEQEDQMIGAVCGGLNSE